MRPNRCVSAALPLLAGSLLLTSCNSYEMFRLAGYEQASFSNDADIVFIIDNSPSMEEEATALAQNFQVFIDTLTTEGALPEGSSSDAVDAYIQYTSARGAYLDYGLSVTTTSVEDPGGTPPGVAGALVGDPSVVEDTDEDVAGAFQRNLLCEATCWNEATLPNDFELTCPEDGSAPETPEFISKEYLDCLCGGIDAWTDHCGSGNEEPLEAAFEATCRAVDPETAPDECVGGESALESADINTSNFLRPDSTVIFVVVTDEGDFSRRLSIGDEDPSTYLGLMDRFGARYRFAIIGPNPDTCQGGASQGVERLQAMAEETEGFYRVIAEPGAGGDCEVADFATYLEDLGALLNQLLLSFPLQSVPDVATLLVYVDGEQIRIATDADYADGEDEPSCDCWEYDASENAIRFYGSAVPDYGDDVDIFYKPLEGQPRTLPF
ncbi:MAG: hypothetical protein VX899_18985 [Myxococcota bacterium]|nr:hypothetical protein [Myxococcota bacterium]